MSASFEIDMSDIIQALEDKLNKVNSALMMYGEVAAKNLESYAKSNHPWTNRTHEAEKRLHGSCEVSGFVLTIALSHGVEYGPLLELGCPPHVIVPALAKALYWDGAEHPVKMVHHPGSQPYPIIMPTIEQMGPEIMRGFTVLME